VPECNLARSFGCHELALDLVCGADFFCTLMCGAGPGDLRGSRGSGSAKNMKKTRPEYSGQTAFRYPIQPRSSAKCSLERTTSLRGRHPEPPLRTPTPVAGTLSNELATCKLPEPYFSPRGLAEISSFLGVCAGLDLVVLGWSRPRGGRDRYSNRFDLNSALVRPYFGHNST